MSNEEKLVKMLKYVSEHNDFYKNRIKEYGITNPLDITQWPVLTRKELQEHRYEMFSNGYKNKYFNQQLRRQTSSGSSGVPVNVYWDYCDYYKSMVPLWKKRLTYYCIHPYQKYVMFNLNAFGGSSNGKDILYRVDRSNVLLINMSLMSNEDMYLKMIDVINEYTPDWMYIQPCILNKISRIYEKYNKRPPSSLKYIETCGELLSDDVRRVADSIFNVHIANMYGSEEMNCIAYECPNHRMHVLSDNVYIEKACYDSNRGETYEIDSTITNLCNFAMPLIRYNQGDKITISKKDSIPCKCGCTDPTISYVSGRVLDYVSINNIEISPYVLMEIIAEVNNKYGDKIKEYKYIFNRKNGELICKIITEKNWEGNMSDRVKEVFYNKNPAFLNIIFSVICVKESLYDPTKKRSIIEFV